MYVTCSDSSKRLAVPAAALDLSSLLDDAHSVDPDGTVPLPFPTKVWHVWCKGTIASASDAATALLVAKLASFLRGDVRAWAVLFWDAAAGLPSLQPASTPAAQLQPGASSDAVATDDSDMEESSSDEDASRAARIQAQRAQLAPLLPHAQQHLQLESPDLAQEFLPVHPLLATSVPLPLKLLLPVSAHAAACGSALQLRDGELSLSVDISEAAVVGAITRQIPRLMTLASVSIYGSIHGSLDKYGPPGAPLRRLLEALAATSALRRLELCVHCHDNAGSTVIDNCGELRVTHILASLTTLTHLRLGGQLVRNGTPYADRSHCNSDLLGLTTLTNLQSLALDQVHTPDTYPEGAMLPLTQLLAALTNITELELDAIPDEEYASLREADAPRCAALRVFVARHGIDYLPSPTKWALNVIALGELTRLELPQFRAETDESELAAGAIEGCAQLRDLKLEWESPADAHTMILDELMELTLLTALHLTVPPLHERVGYDDGEEWNVEDVEQLIDDELSVAGLYALLKHALSRMPHLRRLTADFAGACSLEAWLQILCSHRAARLQQCHVGTAAPVDAGSGAGAALSVRMVDSQPGGLQWPQSRTRKGFAAKTLRAAEHLNLTLVQPDAAAPQLLRYIAALKLTRLLRLRLEFASCGGNVSAAARRLLGSMCALTRLDLLTPTAATVLPCASMLPTLRALHVAPASVPREPRWSSTLQACAAPRAPALSCAATALRSLKLQSASVRHMDGFARIVGGMAELTELHLSDVIVPEGGDAFVCALGPQLASLGALQLLTLQKLRFTAASAESLASGLRGRTQLSMLDLSDYRISDKGARVLAGAFSTLASLSELRLRGWLAGLKCLEELASALAVLPCLRRLMLPHALTLKHMWPWCPELVCVSTAAPVLTLPSFFQSA